MEMKFTNVDDLLGWLVDNRDDISGATALSLEIEAETPAAFGNNTPPPEAGDGGAYAAEWKPEEE